MTVPSDTSSTSILGDGVTTLVPVPFRFLENSHLRVYKCVIATGVCTLQTLDSDYTVSGAGDSSGGSITFIVAPTALESAMVERNVPITQLIDYVANDPFPAESHETGLDKLTMIAQQIWAYISRSLRLMLGDTDGSGRYDANSNRIVNLGNAVDGTDAANLGDVESLILAATLTPGSGTVVGDLLSNYRVLGGTIKQATAGVGWSWYDDASHKPIGWNNTLTTNANGTLTINATWTASKVGTFSVTVDQTYAAAGVSVGASVGANSAILSLFGPWSIRLNNLTAAWGNYLPGTGSTIDTSTATSDGKVVFVHPAITYTDSNGPPILWVKYAAGGNASFVPSSVGKSGFTLQAQDHIAAKVVVSAGVITVTSGLVTNPTVTWDAVNNRFDITTATNPNAFDIMLQAASAGYQPVLEGARSTTLFHVALYDYTGTKAVPGAIPPDVTFEFRRSGLAPAVWNSGNRLWIQRGVVPLSAADVAGGGNLWIGGLHTT